MLSRFVDGQRTPVREQGQLVRRPEDADDPVAHLQGNDDFRAGMRFAGAVEQLLRHIGSVVGLPCGNDLARQTLGDRPPFALVRSDRKHADPNRTARLKPDFPAVDHRVVLVDSAVDPDGHSANGMFQAKLDVQNGREPY